MESLLRARYGAGSTTFPSQNRQLYVGQARTINPAPIRPVRPEQRITEFGRPGMILPARPQYGAPRDCLPRMPDFERMFDGGQILLPPPTTHSSMRTSGGRSDEPLDLSKKEAGVTAETPINCLINLTREMADMEEGEMMEDPVEEGEELDVTGGAGEVGNHI